MMSRQRHFVYHTDDDDDAITPHAYTKITAAAAAAPSLSIVTRAAVLDGM